MIYLISIAAALAGLLFGYDAGVISGALLYIKQSFALSDTATGALVSMVPLGALVFSALGGWFNDRFGRKKILVLSAILFIIGSVFLALAETVSALIFFRFVLGAAIGLGSFTAPIYLAEVAPRKIRGALVTFNQLAITVGIVLSYLVDYLVGQFATEYDWEMMFLAGAIPALILFFSVIGLPESPRWLFVRGYVDRAREILQRIHKPKDAELEMMELKQVSVQESKFSQLIRSGFLRVLLLGIIVSIFTQGVGINAIIYYAPTIFQKTGFDKATVSLFATFGIGIVNVVFTCVAIFLLDKVGRRIMLLIGVVGIIISLIIATISFSLGVSAGLLAWLVLISFIIFIACQAIGTGPACWLIPSEIFPARARGVGMGLAVAFNWATNVVVAFLFPVALKHWGAAWTFAAFLIIAIIAFILFFTLVPETKGVSLEKIEENILQGNSLRQLGKA